MIASQILVSCVSTHTPDLLVYILFPKSVLNRISPSEAEIGKVAKVAKNVTIFQSAVDCAVAALARANLASLLDVDTQADHVHVVTLLLSSVSTQRSPTSLAVSTGAVI